MIASKRWRRFWQLWLERRIPRQKSHRLRHKNIFILPSKAGVSFLILIVLLWLLGTNYQNNLVLSVAFLLLAVFLVCVYYTYGNLSGLQISVLRTHPGFFRQTGQVDLLVKRSKENRYDAIMLFWPEENPVEVSLADQDQLRVTLKIPLKYRGWYQPPRLKVFTLFPLGLMVAWSYLDLDAPILAYPEPIESSLQPEQERWGDSDEVQQEPLVSGHEEFSGLRDYISGDPLKNIDWRAVARGQGLATRVYEEDDANHYRWLDWRQFSGMGPEQRLSRLCASALKQAEFNVDYGLRLPSGEIHPGQGEEHQKAILKALALFEWESR